MQCGIEVLSVGGTTATLNNRLKLIDKTVI